jgi:hypothetical protein
MESSALLKHSGMLLRRLESPFWKIYVPDWFGRMVANHVSLMYQASLFKSIGETDFNHGHLLIQKNVRHDHGYASPEDFFRDVAAILYHTAEGIGRWRKEAAEGVPADLRTPRSILGKRGTIDPHLKKYSLYPKEFEIVGTVNSLEISSALGYIFNGDSMTVIISNERHMPLLEMEIEPRSDGRYEAGGQRYDAYLRFRKK